jgi:hypothetical protein
MNQAMGYVQNIALRHVAIEEGNHITNNELQSANGVQLRLEMEEVSRRIKTRQTILDYPVRPESVIEEETRMIIVEGLRSENVDQLHGRIDTENQAFSTKIRSA